MREFGKEWIGKRWHRVSFGPKAEQIDFLTDAFEVYNVAPGRYVYLYFLFAVISLIMWNVNTFFALSVLLLTYIHFLFKYIRYVELKRRFEKKW